MIFSSEEKSALKYKQKILFIIKQSLKSHFKLQVYVIMWFHFWNLARKSKFVFKCKSLIYFKIVLLKWKILIRALLLSAQIPDHTIHMIFYMNCVSDKLCNKEDLKVKSFNLH